MIVLDRFGQRLSPGHFSAGFLGITALLAVLGTMVAAAVGPGVGAWVAWLAGMLANREVVVSLACQAVLPTALGFHWMNTYQPRVSATRAALIYLLEPVFTSFFSVWWGHDRWTGPLLLGGA